MEERRWHLDHDDGRHVVELAAATRSGAPSRFEYDGLAGKIPGNFFQAHRTASFALGPHAAKLTWQKITPSFTQALRRQIGGGKKSLPAAILGYLVDGQAGATAASSVAAASVRQPAWIAYELTVDDMSCGSWVVDISDMARPRWTYVRSGDPLPDASSPEWPGPPPYIG